MGSSVVKGAGLVQETEQDIEGPSGHFGFVKFRLIVRVTGDAGFGIDLGAGTGFVGGGATLAGLRVWITFEIGSTGWGADIGGAGF